MNAQDLIIGIHSIYHALINAKRDGTNSSLYCTKEGLDHLLSRYSNLKKIKLNTTVLSVHDFQEKTKKLYQEFDFEWNRINSQLLLVTNHLASNPNDLFDLIKKKDDLVLVALDQITDIHNAGAITRTCAYYKVDGIIYSNKKTFRLSPGYFRVASGGAEYVPLYCVPSLSKWLKKFSEQNITIVALTEDGKIINQKENLFTEIKNKNKKVFVMGEEENGISHACLMNSTYKVRLDNEGPISTLNVSNATCVTLEKFCGN